MAARLGLDMDVVEAARASVAPERLQLEELLTAAAESERRAATARADADRLRTEARASAELAANRAIELQGEIELVRASAQQARERALEQAERELAVERRELEELRSEIRAARASERARRAEPSTPAAQRAERERDRRLGAASERVRARVVASSRRSRRCGRRRPLARRRPGDLARASACAA